MERFEIKTKIGRDINIGYSDLKNAALVIRSINHKLRQRIIEILEYYGKMMVTDIYTKLRLEQAIISQNLAILRKSGVVIAQRQGKFIYYSLDKLRLEQIRKLVESF